MKKALFPLPFLLASALLCPHIEAEVRPTAVDSVRPIIDLEEAVVVASPKESAKLRRQPLSVSIVDGTAIEHLRIDGLKDLTGFVPGLFMPDYGSRLTTAVYVRGVGSRTGSPAVGLYVDNLPAAGMSAYDINLLDVERIDVLRGPQGTLYGAGAMGGLMRVTTASPFVHQGTRISLGGYTRAEGRRVAVSTLQRLGSKWGLAAGAFYEGRDGFFRNDSTGRKVDGLNAGGGRLRLEFRPTERWRMGLTAKYEYTDQGGYPYRYTGTVSGEEALPAQRGRITANREAAYRRNLVTTGLDASYRAPRFVLTSVTGYQHLSDRMFMDQDFTAADLFSLEQRQHDNSWTEELTVKNRVDRRWARTTGAFLQLRRVNTAAPVTFYSDGMNMLNERIAGYVPAISMNNPLSGRPLTMEQSLTLTDAGLRLDGHFSSPTTGYALFHQSTFKDLLPRLDLTIGLRFEGEHMRLDYHAGGTPVAARYAMSMIAPYDYSVAPALHGRQRNNSFQALPKLGLTWRLGQLGNAYAVVAKGYRSGGYNIQMYSDLLQQALQSRLMGGVREHVDDVLQQQIDGATTPALRSMFEGIKRTVDAQMPTFGEPDAHTVHYKPEFTWNYEVGAHLRPLEWLEADAAVFFMRTRNQQILRMAGSGLGRQMVNAGRSNSCGAEVSLRATLLGDRLQLMAGYGFTHAEFRRWADGRTDYRGNHVPFIPAHTLSAAAEYGLPLHRGLIDRLSVGLNMSGAGRIYWTEQNNAYQNFYALLGAHLKAELGPAALNLWAKNLTCTRYDTFYFESMNRGFAQRGVPCHAGFDLSLRF